MILLTPNLIADEMTAGAASPFPWWGWSMALFALCFLLGIFAILAGIGGGILYVPIVGSLFPFHIDFVRGTAMLIILTGALAAAPRLLKSGLASLRLAMAMALTSSMGALIGARLGLNLSANTVNTALGIIIFWVTGLMMFSQRIKVAKPMHPSLLTKRIGLSGIYTDVADGSTMEWNAYRPGLAIFLFFFAGILSGMFGMGGGWANVPIMNLLMGVPLKVSAATSILIIAFNGTAASWVYINKGAILPVIALPSVVGMMLGSRLGAKLLGRIKQKYIRYIVSAVLLFVGIQSIARGLLKN